MELPALRTNSPQTHPITIAEILRIGLTFPKRRAVQRPWRPTLKVEGKLMACVPTHRYQNWS